MFTGMPSTVTAKSVPWSRLKPRRKYWLALPSPECCVATTPGTASTMSPGRSLGRLWKDSRSAAPSLALSATPMAASRGPTISIVGRWFCWAQAAALPNNAPSSQGCEPTREGNFMDAFVSGSDGFFRTHIGYAKKGLADSQSPQTTQAGMSVRGNRRCFFNVSNTCRVTGFTTWLRTYR